MTLKATWLWNGTARNGQLSFGFSETWYTDDAPAQLLPKMENVALVRASIIATNTVLFGYRIQDTAAGARAYTAAPTVVVEGVGRGRYPNVPQDAALCQVLGTVGGTVKRFWMHDLPDGLVANADFVGQEVQQQARNFINALAQNGFKFRYLNQNAGKAKIQGIDANGNVTLLEPLAGLGVSSVLQLFHVRGTDGRGKRGMFPIKVYTDDKHFQLDHWTGSVVGMSGYIRKVEYGYTSLQNVPMAGFGSDPTIKPGTRKCGRPFGSPRGRAVARR